MTTQTPTGATPATVTPTTATLHGVVPVTYVQLLYDYVNQQGLQAEDILGAMPKTETGLGRFPVQTWRQLLQKASQALQDPLLGLHLGSTVQPKHFGLLGYVFLSCGTLGGALQRLQQYHRLIYDVSPLETHLTNNIMTLIWGQSAGTPGNLVDETAITALIQFCRDIIAQDDYAPLSVAFVNPTPDNVQAYTQWYGCPVLFEQQETRIQIPLSTLATPLRSADPALMQVLEQQANALLNNIPEHDRSLTSQKVRQTIAQQLHTAEPKAEQVARELHISERTLHRKLEAENTHFRQLLQEVRHELAKQYLLDPRIQLAEVAQLLAYSEQSAFSRAFKQWQAQTPAQYRRALSSET